MNQLSQLDDLTNSISLYVETDSGIIFEAKFFDDYAILRPATPELFRNIRKISYTELAGSYEDFCGDRADVFRHLTTGEPMEFTQETRH